MPKKTDLAPYDNFLQQLAPVENKEVIQGLNTVKPFPPYMSVIQSTSKFKHAPFEIEEGSITLHYGNDKAVGIGKKVDAIFFDMIPLAQDWSGGGRPIVATDPESDEWKRIVDNANAQGNMSPYKWGYNFLVWLPQQEIIATMFCNTPSLRYFASAEIVGSTSSPGKFQKPLTLISSIKQDKKDGRPVAYYVLSTIPCNTPFTMPDINEAREEQIRFRRATVATDVVEEAETSADEQVR